VADLTSWYWSRGKSLNNPFAEKKTYAVLEALDGDGVAHYILGSNGKGVTAEIARDLQRMMPDLIIADGIGKHAEIAASTAARSRGFTPVRGAISKYSCSDCAGSWAAEGIENLTGSIDEFGKVTRPRIPNALSAAQDIATMSRLRSIARTVAPLVDAAAAPLSVVSLGMNLGQGRYADAVLGDLTGVGGTVVGFVVGNPMVAGGLGAFSAGYGLTMGALEWAFGEVPPMSWDDIF
jgi:hypothetical protein